MLERFFGRKISTCRGGIFSALNAPTRTIHSVAAFVAVFGRKILRPYRCCKAIRPNIPTCTTHSVAVFVAVFVVRISTCKAIHSTGVLWMDIRLYCGTQAKLHSSNVVQKPSKSAGWARLAELFFVEICGQNSVKYHFYLRITSSMHLSNFVHIFKNGFSWFQFQFYFRPPLYLGQKFYIYKYIY